MEHLLRTRAFALAILGGITAAMVVVVWFDASFGLLLPVIAAYFLFNFGFARMVVKAGSLTKATRLGMLAVLLNFVAMLMSGFEIVWIVASSAATIVAFAAAFLLAKEARAAAA